ncbi:FAD/NAD(P)-binding domain-containing protein [Punctularia strigosozonata HHB-11173 SS5]|uniref:FAD/NAD(P)-binding domain-containing protein n=1 Tax=Punctularia strigosozonata (strain HHB-11173) TaxID=741275 RepID=R7S5K4_PUNST|nr:FAD/NAD(P)-binding domain-containing protein [Punctularia strigosozonata HHB-11173 SS5]EIN04706.1 FAD/NAD(P)-binding domain-containing protein [Punctularia strigosozonata HHB-11173 SS5]
MSSSTSACPLRFIIVGGSIAGMASALALRKAGHEVLLLEKSDGMYRSPIGIVCMPNMVRQLIRFGLPLERLERESTICARSDLRHGGTNAFMGRVYFAHPDIEGDLGAKVSSIQHGQLRTWLEDLAREAGAKMRFNSLVTQIDPQRASVRLSTGETLEGDIILAADGWDSIVRPVVTGEQSDIQRTGRAGLHMTIPQDRVEKDEELRELLLGGEAAQWVVWYGNGCCVEVYSLPHVKQYSVRLHATVRTDASIVPDWTARRPLDASRSVTDLTADLEHFHSIVKRLIALADAVTPMPYLKMDPLESWVHEDNKVALLGDAAFIQPSGATYTPSASIGDAETLAALFSRLSSRTQIAPLLSAYEDIRAPHVAQHAAASAALLTALSFPLGPAEAFSDLVSFAPDAQLADAAEEDGRSARLHGIWTDFFAVCAHDEVEAAESWWRAWGGPVADQSGAGKGKGKLVQASPDMLAIPIQDQEL